MPAAPTLILLAGPNGAGKSTLYAGIIWPRLPGIPFINADDHERERLSHVADPIARSSAAREWADAERTRCLSESRSFATETVFSHESKIELIREAKSAGFEVLLLVVCCDDVDLLVARVAWRAAHGKHAVPEARIRERYPRTIANLLQAIPLADFAHLYDNTGSPDSAGETTSIPRLVAVIESAVLIDRSEAVLPEWAVRVMSLVRNAPAS